MKGDWNILVGQIVEKIPENAATFLFVTTIEWWFPAAAPFYSRWHQVGFR